MFNLTQRANNTQPLRISGTIVCPDNTRVTLTDRTLAQKGISITKHSVTGDILEFGAATLGELKLSFWTDLSRYKFYNAHIELSLNDGEIPLGVWTVAESERVDKAVKLTAYDNLIKLEKRFSSTIIGTPFELMRSIAKDCGLELGQSATDYASFVNGTELITIGPESGCNTYRKAASAIALMMCCFVIADRSGKLVVRQFSKELTLVLGMGDRYSSTIADYNCSYDNFEVTGLAGTFVSTIPTQDQSLTMYVDDSPAWDTGSEILLQSRANKVMSYISDLRYTPCSISIPSNPLLECGDRLLLETRDGNVETLITSITWEYDAPTSIESVGKNPYLLDTSKESSRVVRTLQHNTTGAALTFYAFKNASDVSVGTKGKIVGSVMFTATEDTNVQLNATLQLGLTVPDVVTTQKIAVLDDSGEPKEYIVRDTKLGQTKAYIWYAFNDKVISPIYEHMLTTGEHMLTLYYPILGVEANVGNKLEIWMRLENGSGLIPMDTLQGTVVGQGLYALDRWDGRLEITDTITVSEIPNMQYSVVDVHSSHNVDINRNHYHPSYTETLTGIEIANMVYSADVTRDRVYIPVDNFELTFIKTPYVVKNDDNNLVLNKDYMYNEIGEPIDSGYLKTLLVRTDDKESIESVTFSGEGVK